MAPSLKMRPMQRTSRGGRVRTSSSRVAATSRLWIGSWTCALCTLASLWLWLPSSAAAPRAARRPWVLTSDEDGIRSFKREVPGSSIIALRGEGLVHAPITRVATVVLDNTRAPEWVDSLEETRVIRMLGPQEFIGYTHVNTPPIVMADRDFVVRGKVDVDLKERSLTMRMWPARDPAVPEKSSYVRGELSAFWKLKSVVDGRKTFVVAEIHADPRGGVAKWLVNWVQENWPRNTFESLREQVAKRDIRIMPQVAAAFAGKPINFAPAPARR